MLRCCCCHCCSRCIRHLCCPRRVCIVLQLKPDRPQLNPDAASKPNEPIKVADFVHALECIVRSSGNAVNPEQLQEILDELLQANLLEQFTPQQLAASLKNLAVICTRLPEPVVESLIRQAGRQMALFTVPQLSNIGWALMRLAPVADAEYRQEYGLDQQWLQQYGATCEQQLQQVVEQQQPLPTGQQLANLLLVPAAVQQPLSPSGMQLLEQALLLSERRLCGMAVAQLLTCFVRCAGGLAIKPTLCWGIQLKSGACTASANVVLTCGGMCGL